MSLLGVVSRVFGGEPKEEKQARVAESISALTDKERYMASLYREARDEAIADSEGPDGHIKDKYFKLDAAVEARLELKIGDGVETGFSAADVMSFIDRQQRVNPDLVGAISLGDARMLQPAPLYDGAAPS